MTTGTGARPRVGVWRMFRESSTAVKATLLGTFINRVGGFLNLFLVLFLTAEGYSGERATLALGVYGAGSVVGVLVGGSLAERLGARNATVLGTASSAVLIASLLYLPAYWMLLAAAGLAGLVSQIYRPASAALLSDLTPHDQQVMIFAMYRFSLNLGTTAAPLLGYALYHLNGNDYTLVFWGEASIALAYALIALVALPARVAPGADAGDGAGPGPTGSYLAVLADRRYAVYLASMLFNSIVYVQFLSTLPLDVGATGLAVFWYTVAISLNGLLVIAFELPVTKFSQTLAPKVTIAVAFGMIGLGNALYGLPLSSAVILLGTLVWTAGEIIGAPAAFAYPTMAGPAYLKTRYIGSFQFVYGLGGAIGPIIGGVLFARMGHSVWPVIAVAGAVATVLALIGVRPGVNAASGTEPAAGSAEVAGTVEPDPHAVTTLVGEPAELDRPAGANVRAGTDPGAATGRQAAPVDRVEPPP